MFVAQSQEMFEAEGLEVTLRPHRGPWSDLIRELVAGTSDIVLGNVWFAMQDWRGPNQLLPIAHCVQQCGSVVVQRRGSHDAFDWTQLEGRTMAVQSDVPTPWIALRECLRLHGVSADKVRLLIGLSTVDAIEALGTSVVDYAVLHVDRAQHDALEEVAALADVIGPVPWSVFMASRAAVNASPDPYRRFQRAIGRALQWMAAQQGDAIAKAIAPWFALVDSDLAARTIDRHRAMQAWPSGAAVPAGDVARWQEMLVRWGLMAAPISVEPLLRFMHV